VLAERYYTEALEINALYPRIWFALGCVQMRLEKLEDALNSFTRVVHQDPEDGEAWNNMASAWISLGKKYAFFTFTTICYDFIVIMSPTARRTEAYRCMQEASKLRFESHNIWENMMYIAVVC